MQGTHSKKNISFASYCYWLGMGILLIGSFMLFFFTPASAQASTATIVTYQVTGPQIPVGQKGTLTASCESGEQMLSGGFSGDAFEGAVKVVESYPSAPNTWTVTVDNSIAPSWVQMTVSVYCLQASSSIGTTIVHATQSTAGTQILACPRGSVLLSGGYTGTAQPSISKPDANSWQSNAATVYAMCARRHVTASSVATAALTTPPVEAEAGATATCASNQLATGGGFSVDSGSVRPIVSSQDTTTGWSVAVAGSPYGSPTTMTISAVCTSIA
ncbi:hypothetical protein KSF_050210 [Reticulibacter mediterranei]|uniref:Uncharacterized protein n=2 Tax=Reticulibacter mediterranei TaxID=2778369 RepID=A0A8J3N413_9CHLR|nr:hypothetical protein KSF_050210 [Reticulibacter mediterranei]